MTDERRPLVLPTMLFVMLLSTSVVAALLAWPTEQLLKIVATVAFGLAVITACVILWMKENGA